MQVKTSVLFAKSHENDRKCKSRTGSQDGRPCALWSTSSQATFSVDGTLYAAPSSPSSGSSSSSLGPFAARAVAMLPSCRTILYTGLSKFSTGSALSVRACATLRDLALIWSANLLPGNDIVTTTPRKTNFTTAGSKLSSTSNAASSNSTVTSTAAGSCPVPIADNTKCLTAVIGISSSSTSVPTVCRAVLNDFSSNVFGTVAPSSLRMTMCLTNSFMFVAAAISTCFTDRIVAFFNRRSRSLGDSNGYHW
mmetsp:Transcript_34181/g.103200  ORF Transcript_34181/g.103200 Transcript_34181/m.103200 type:complete len:251 (+) Transcript_34181:583-1335(+)